MSHGGSGRAKASLYAGTGRVCHLLASQVEKGKDLELEEQFDALRREHMETLQGACRDSRAPRSPPARYPPTASVPPASCGVMGMLPPCSMAPWGSGGALCPGVPVLVTLSSCPPCRAPESA